MAVGLYKHYDPLSDKLAKRANASCGYRPLRCTGCGQHIMKGMAVWVGRRGRKLPYHRGCEHDH